MKIKTNELLTSSKRDFDFEISDEVKDITLDGRKLTFNKTPFISIKIEKNEDEELIAHIDITINARINCVRCLDEMYVDTVVNVSGRLTEEDDFSDEDVILVSDGQLDTDLVLEDAVFEVLNDNLFCSPSCKGLCQICGVNLNHETCNCNAEGNRIDPRLEQLKKFFN